MVSVPDTLDEALSTSWLSEALQASRPGTEVVAVHIGIVDERVSTNVQFRADCADGSVLDLWVKGYFSELGRQARVMTLAEAYFYRDLLASTGLRTLTCLYADVDPETQHAVIITADIAHEGAIFLNGNSSITPDQAAESLEQFARLHAATWGRPDLADQAWLAPRLALMLGTRGRDVLAACLALDTASGVPAEVRDAEALARAYEAVGVRDARLPWCVIHGDAHPGNLYLDPAGRPSLVDWQLVQRGSWFLDVGYHIASTLPVEDRRTHERDLLRHYLSTLSSLGVDAPSEDEAWALLPGGLVHGMYLWSITQFVVPEVTTTLLHRLGTAVVDHDAFTSVAATP